MPAQPGQVTRPGAGGEGDRTGVKVVEWFLLDGVARKRGDRAIDQCVERALAVLPRAAPAHLTVGQLAAPFAGQAAHFVAVAGRLLQSCHVNERRVHGDC